MLLFMLMWWDYVPELQPLTDVLFIRPSDIWVWRATVNWNWKGKTELREKPVPVPLCPPQIPHELTRARTRASAVRIINLLIIWYCNATRRFNFAVVGLRDFELLPVTLHLLKFSSKIHPSYVRPFNVGSSRGFSRQQICMHLLFPPFESYVRPIVTS
jgi:hypothetical protein